MKPTRNAHGSGLSELSGIRRDAVISILVLMMGMWATVPCVHADGGAPPLHVSLYNGTWSALGQGTNGSVFALCEYGGELIAAGDFTQAGGGSTNYIAKWNGSSWSALGSGLSGIAKALVVCGNDLYVGGVFTTAGNVTVNRIAKWDGSTWSSVGGGVSNTVWALACYGGNLYAGGQFDRAGTLDVKSVAVWNGTSWDSLAGQDLVGNQVLTFGSYDGDLILGTDGFDDRVLRYDGSSLSTTDAPMGGDKVVAAGIFDNDLVVGGEFTAEGVVSDNIGLWDGSDWDPVGPGFYDAEGGQQGGDVMALEGLCGRLFATGDFMKVGTTTMQHIARWDGTSWTALGSGLNGSGEALTIFDGKLIVGGQFTSAGGNTVGGVAKWTEVCLMPKTELPGAWSITVSPNPSRSSVLVSFTAGMAGKVKISVYDVGGRLTQTLLSGAVGAGEQTIAWSFAEMPIDVLPTGMYFVKMETEEGVTTTRLSIIR